MREILSTPHAAPLSFQSFVMGGFEGSTLQFHDRRRIDPISETRHDIECEADYRMLAQRGVHTVRDALRWHRIESVPGMFDWTDFRMMIESAKRANVQVLWDLCHFGVPEHIDIFAPEFPERFAGFAAAAGRVLAEHSAAAPWWCPINEISYWAHAAGHDGFMHPSCIGAAAELKRQLVKAWLLAAAELKRIDPRARFIATDPLIHVTHRGDASELASAACNASLETFDQLLGYGALDVGHPRSVDVIGLNFYPHNQWCVEDHQPVGLGMNGYRPLHLLLSDVWNRYGRPILVSETGAEADSGPAWLRHVSSEVAIAREMGIPIMGICIYPVMDYPAWVDDRPCRTGLIKCVQHQRTICPEMAKALAHTQQEQKIHPLASYSEPMLRLVP